MKNDIPNYHNYNKKNREGFASSVIFFHFFVLLVGFGEIFSCC
jgi:hypothetical protein